MNRTDTKGIAGALACLVGTALLLAACAGPAERPTPHGESTDATSQSTGDGATCAAHGAPKELCFICDAGLRDRGRLWCQEHARYEDRCWECHPELRDASRLWCQEHSLYEDECFLCHPELLEERSGPVEGATGASTRSDATAPGLMCDEHRLPEQECGICQPELLARNQPGRGLKVRLPAADSAARAGVVVGAPRVERMERVVECFAELTFDQNRLAQITSLVDGVVQSVDVDLGSRVAEGDLLLRLTSVAMGQAQSAYLTALAEHRLRSKSLERERDLLAQRIASEREFQEAEAAQQTSRAAVRQAHQQLMVLGADPRQIDALDEQAVTPGIVDLRAPFAGEIVQRTAVQGAKVGIGQTLLVVADPGVLWALVNIPESQLRGLETGQAVELTVDSLAGQTFPGKLTWLSASVDERTRMAQGRVEVANPDRRLKARMFARARILTATPAAAVVVPQSAVQDVGGTPVVFVRSAEDLFEARPVTLGSKRDGDIEITSGVELQEPVVVAGGFALKSQFLLSRLGAGCVDE